MSLFYLMTVFISLADDPLVTLSDAPMLYADCLTERARLLTRWEASSRYDVGVPGVTVHCVPYAAPEVQS